jgi:hypothetical protein
MYREARVTKIFPYLLFASLTTPNNVMAWEATYYQHVSEPMQKLLASEIDGQPFNSARVQYPADEGVQLGQGWDMFLNKKVNSTCIDFKGAQRDNYETAELNLQEVTDEETRDATLNMTFTIEGGASYAGYGGKGNSSLTKNSFSHFYSKDVLVVGHATVSNGAAFVAPDADPVPAPSTLVGAQKSTVKRSQSQEPASGFRSVTLSADLNKLWHEQFEKFRSKCGDGFIASINYGTDFYGLYTFHIVDKKTRDQLETAVKTSGGYAGFTAGGSAAISQLIVQESNAGRLAIEYVQRGGKITDDLPTDLDSLKSKIKTLGKEAWFGPKPIYMVVVPYSQLPELRGEPNKNYSTVLQAAIRYQIRMRNIHAEILAMQDDYYRDRTTAATDNYLYPYAHLMRSEDLQIQRQSIEDEIDRVTKIIELLSTCPQGCEKDSDREDKLKKLKEAVGERKHSVAARIYRASNGQASDGSGKTEYSPFDEELEFDDLKYWIQLSLPMNALPQEAISLIQNQAAPADQRIQIFARYLYQHWIQRQDSARCSLFFECLSQKRKLYYYNAILASLKDPGTPLVSAKLVEKTKNQAEITIKPCTKIIVTNSRSAQYDNSFTLKDTKGTDIFPEQHGGQSVNAEIQGQNKQRTLELAGFYETGFGKYGYRADMWATAIHPLGSFLTTIWFYDPGATQSGPGNLAVYFQAIPEPTETCQPAP